MHGTDLRHKLQASHSARPSEISPREIKILHRAQLTTFEVRCRTRLDLKFRDPLQEFCDGNSDLEAGEMLTNATMRTDTERCVNDFFSFYIEIPRSRAHVRVA